MLFEIIHVCRGNMHLIYRDIPFLIMMGDSPDPYHLAKYPWFLSPRTLWCASDCVVWTHYTCRDSDWSRRFIVWRQLTGRCWTDPLSRDSTLATFIPLIWIVVHKPLCHPVPTQIRCWKWNFNTLNNLKSSWKEIRNWTINVPSKHLLT